MIVSERGFWEWHTEQLERAMAAMNVARALVIAIAEMGLAVRQLEGESDD